MSKPNPVRPRVPRVFRRAVSERPPPFGKKAAAALLVLLLPLGILTATPGVALAQAPVGQGFTVTPSDLAYILEQIKISETHVANTTSATGPCGALRDAIGGAQLSFGLRTVDGSCNNLVAGSETFGAAGTLFPRLATKTFQDAEPVPPGFGPPGPTSYADKTDTPVFDSEPRVISNLIVDQTAANPAAIEVAGNPARTQGNAGVQPCIVEPTPTSPGEPAGCTPKGETLFIPNVTTDVGLSPPFNGLFTIFGQFFDHGVDLTAKGGNGVVFVPLKSDDPLISGPDGVLGNGDDLPANKRFMVLTRATNQPGPDGVRGTADDVQDSTNLDSSWVDQSQTYSSNPSHQVFLREYTNNTLGRPVSTGSLISGAPRTATSDGGQGTWRTLKDQARALLGLEIADSDVGNIPVLAVDPYGKFVPGPLRGLPQYVTGSGLVEGDTAAPVPVPADAFRVGDGFLDDIAHNAVPKPGLTPDPDTTITGATGVQPSGTYDNEMLEAHFVAGDGRVNENIALSAVHQVFHSEHDRLVTEIKQTLNSDTSPQGQAALAEWTLAEGAGGWNGERLFQAARFITEMEYQHIVFEEFARKVQPALDPFRPFAFTQTDTNASTRKEFADAVYRFGHSMLTEDIARINEDGSRNDIPLLDGFLNPPSYTQGGPAGLLNPEQAAGSIIMGMSDQVGNEIDEFVTDTLRNNLLGLPLDLATLNLARARDGGVPSLNNFRKEIFGRTNSGELTPYTNWITFGEGIKNPSSLVNFVAAYGQHPTILSAGPGPDALFGTADDAPATLASRREAARLIVNPDTVAGDVPPADAPDFMGSVGNWANTADGRSRTGVDDIDLWVGGLAERTNLFGGLLGPTFNYVFENQMADLQNGDRLYYLARTTGMNLRTSLEGNSFAELMMRNTSANSLKADSFGTADCKFQLANLNGTAAGYQTFGTTVADDPATECDERALLLRLPDGTIKYRTSNTVDPPGINGQSVFNGTPGTDRVWGGVDNDTVRGNETADIIEGGDGADHSIGGDGNDIITDSAGDDFLKGGPGNDALNGGIGLDVLLGGDGKDVINGGANDNSTFAGEGDDLLIGGGGVDVIIGDGGDDWQEGGDQPDLLIGDSSSLFFTDPNAPGNDISIGQAGDDDYDGEGGNDIFVAGPGLEKNAGAAGYDFSTAKGDPQRSDADLALPIAPEPIPVNELRDRWNEVEGLSGWDLDDTLRGDDIVPTDRGGGGFIGCDVLDQAGLDAITGLDALVPPLTVDSAPIIASSASLNCPISGPVWGDGNILLGGSGSDLIEGRGANDIIDGDMWLNVRLSVRTDAADPATEIGSADLMTAQYLRDANGALTGPTLQQDVFAGLIDPGNIVAVREILSTPAPADVDVALFSGASTEYTITQRPEGGVTVAHTGGAATDGTDTITGVELLRFTDRDVSTVPNRAPAGAPIVTFGQNTTVVPNVARLTPQENIAIPSVDTSGISDPDGLGPFTFQWQQRGVGSALAPNPIAGATGPGFTPTQAVVGRALSVVVSYTDGAGNPESVTSADTPPVGDLFPGTANADNFAGGAGEDLVSGLAANDTLGTGAGADVITGGTGNDTVNAGSANDVIRMGGTGDGFDTVNGQADADRLEATLDNTVIGLSSITGVEQISGGGFFGVRVLGSGAANNFNLNMVELLGIVSVDGGGGNDTISMPDTANSVLGGTGNDTILGRGGNDTVDGGGGNDILNGGLGNDTISVSLNNDTVVLESAFGADRVTNFDANGGVGAQDFFDLRPLGITAATFASQVIIEADPASATSTRIRIGGNSVIVPSVNQTNFTQADFILAP